MGHSERMQGLDILSAPVWELELTLCDRYTGTLIGQVRAATTAKRSARQGFTACV